ncbi:GNAT family N-acetyltransferase [Alkanindiges sp. WGS2144]|uniref:GNAT family N-acetyltransferase n=1 Tax=Alkanindiges sp. WGS2144 TaxID=3366808 RepID=UPI0037503B89
MRADLSYQVRILESVTEAAEFFMQLKLVQPFLKFEFWQALEQAQAVGASGGWKIAHVLLEHQGQPVAFMPLFIKSHHRGEYVFDHSWADAYARHGLDYYPRLVSSLPFTPVTGQRILMVEGYSLAQVWPFIFQAVQDVAIQYYASSWHALFIDEALLRFFQVDSPDLAIRYHCQFLWTNQGYQHFDDFLAALTAKKRKSIKVERQKIAQQGIEIQRIEGLAINQGDIDFFYQCYSNTYDVRGQRPYLNQAFFSQLIHEMPQHIMLVVAKRNDQPIAAALFFKDEHTLYGRYWGALEQVDCLHFEVCYYQGVDYAITNKLQNFDPGTQGEHKLIRGFAPVYTYSAHWLGRPEFMEAVQAFCQKEKHYVDEYYQAALASTPFKQTA